MTLPASSSWSGAVRASERIRRKKDSSCTKPSETVAARVEGINTSWQVFRIRSSILGLNDKP